MHWSLTLSQGRYAKEMKYAMLDGGSRMHMLAGARVFDAAEPANPAPPFVAPTLAGQASATFPGE